MRVKRIDALICMLFYAIFKIYAMPTLIQQVTKIVSILIVCVFLATNVRKRKLLNIMVPFSLAIMVSGVYAYARGFNSFDSMFDGILYAICLYCLFTLLQYCREKNDVDRFLNCFYFMASVYAFVSLFFVLSQPRADISSRIYFIGDKFATSYLFILLAALFLVKYDEKIKKRFRYKVIYFGLAAFSTWISYHLFCTTALIASLFLIVSPLLPLPVKRKLQSAKIIVAAIVATLVILISISAILMNPHVQYIIEDVLGENLSLHGRTFIYAALWEIISNSACFGYGYGNSIVAQVIGYGNAQNGLLQIAVNYGVVGAILFLILVYRCVSKRTHDRYWGLYALAYAMIIASIVEISFGYEFYFAIFAICANPDRLRETENPVKSV